MASRYEVLAQLIDSANIQDEYGLMDDLKRILRVLHEHEGIMPAIHPQRVINAVYEEIAESWVQTDWDNLRGPDPEPEPDPESEPVAQPMLAIEEG